MIVNEPEMVRVPAGPFVLGTSEKQIARLANKSELARRWQKKGYFSREQPGHTLGLADFEIGKFPVTVGEYKAFIEAGGYDRRHYWTEAGWAWRQEIGVVDPNGWDDKRWTGDERLPVVGVSWYESLAYTRWLAEASGRAYHLPTEAEWEKAARGTDGRLFPWGMEYRMALCNGWEAGLGRTTPVGQYSPDGDSPYGCVDMAGNVSEWTSSQYRPYPYDGQDGRENLQGEVERVLRGGSWHSMMLRLRVVSRGMNDPFFTDRDVGFRCACSD